MPSVAMLSIYDEYSHVFGCVERKSMKYVTNAERAEKEFRKWYVVGYKQVSTKTNCSYCKIYGNITKQY